MNKYQTYFGQIVTDDELNEIFGSFATAIEQFVGDFNYVGIAVGGEVTQNSSPNLSVLVNGPGVIYDQFARRIAWGAPININCSIDENNQPTTVAGSLNEKWLSIFVKFVEIPSDPREDELGNVIFFRRSAGYQFKVVQGSEAPVGTAPRPALRADQILLGDVRLIANQTSILNADVSSTRSQVIFDLTGTPLAIRAKDLHDALQKMVDGVNSITTDTLIVPAIPGSPTSLPQGSVHAVFQAFLIAFNALKTQVGTLPPNLNGVALLAANQTFSGTNAFSAQSNFGAMESSDQLNFTTTDPQRPLVATVVTPSAAKWKLIFEFKHGVTAAGGQYIRMYSGSDGTTSGNGAFVITANCGWNGTEWEQRDPVLSSIGVIWTYNRLRISHKYAGAGNWADWDSTLPGGVDANQNGVHLTENLVVNGNARIGGNVECNELKANGQSDVQAIKINGNVTTAGGTLTLVGDLDCFGITAGDLAVDDIDADNINGNAFLYRSGAKYRRFEMPIAHGQPWMNTSNWAPCWAFVNGVWQAVWTTYDNQPTPGTANPNPILLDIPLLLPHGAVLKKIEVQHYMPTTVANDFRLYRLKSNWGTMSAPPGPSGSPASDLPNDDWWGSDNLESTAGWHETSLESFFGTGLTINRADSEYVLRCYGSKTGVPSTNLGAFTSSNGSVVARVRCTWDDPGPRNY